LILRLHGFSLGARTPYQIAFLPAPVSFARTPHDLDQLRETVRRDQAELTLAFRRRKTLAGPFGWRILRDLYFDRSVRPKLETAAYVLAAAGLVMGWVDWKLALFVLLSTAGMGMMQSIAALVLREVAQPGSSDPAQSASLLWAAVAENFGYRQLRNLWLIAASFASTPTKKQNRGQMVVNHPPAAPDTSAKA
jgi:hypothetical protein